MRRVLVFLIAGMTSAACGAPAVGPAPVTPAVTASGTATSPGAQVLSIADAIVDDQFAESPDLVARLRPPGARFDYLPGDSLAELATREAREDQWRANLASVDRAS